MTPADPALADAGLTCLLRQPGAALWRALEATERARSRRQWQEYADRCEALQPELAKELRAALRQGPMA
jgi:flagellar biosynthesis regulator FlaF